MPRSENLSRPTRRNLKNSKFTKLIRTITPLLVASIALGAAVAFSMSAQSSGLAWLWKAQPAAATGKVEPATSSAPQAPAVKSGKSVNYMALPPAAAAIVTATKTDSLITDVDMDGKADPGDTLKYTVVIGASGEDATGVQFSDTVDPNTD
ncbi:MAG TPA: hypothetical protein VLB87_00115, partial [Pyrinomonadaceae bacterium]|nr:hypothetical protein [Pyrinomonadaceae bacterium]